MAGFDSHIFYTQVSWPGGSAVFVYDVDDVLSVEEVASIFCSEHGIRNEGVKLQIVFAALNYMSESIKQATNDLSLSLDDFRLLRKKARGLM